jgi:hypothetical protein
MAFGMSARGQDHHSAPVPPRELTLGSDRVGSAPAERLLGSGSDRLLVLRSDLGWRPFVRLLFGDRDGAVAVLTRSLDGGWPVLVLPIDKVRAIVGPKTHLVYLPGHELQRRLRGLLGRALAVAPGSVRVYWPGLSTGSDPAAHPLVPILPDEPESGALAALRLNCDLTRRGIRNEIMLVEEVFAPRGCDTPRFARPSANSGGRLGGRRLTACPRTHRAG